MKELLRQEGQKHIQVSNGDSDIIVVRTYPSGAVTLKKHGSLVFVWVIVNRRRRSDEVQQEKRRYDEKMVRY